MLKRLRSYLISPLAGLLEKLQERMLKGFKLLQETQAESKSQIKERLSMLARQVDESRDEFHRGFRIQEEALAALSRQLDQVISVVSRLESGAALVKNSNAGQTQSPVLSGAGLEQPQDAGKPPAMDDVDRGVVDMWLEAGGRWLAEQRREGSAGRSPG